MKSNLNSKSLPVLAAGLGCAAALLRLGLYAFGTDEKGLLNNGHILSLLVWAVTAFAALFICLEVRKLGGSARYEDNFGPSAAAAMGTFALAGGIAVTVVSGWETWLRLEMIRNFLGLLSIPALLWVGLRRRRGRQSFFLFHALLCLYLTLHTVSHYQIWCSRPQLQDFLFPMAGSILLALFAYYQTAFDVAMGKRRMQLGVGLLGAFACIAAAAGGEDILLYTGGAVWMLTNLCSLTPVPTEKTEKKENGHEAA